MNSTEPVYGQVSQLRLGAWGDIKTAKSTLALSFPKPLVHLDLDLSVIRAIHRFTKDYTVEQVPMFTPLSKWLASRKEAPLPDIIIVPYQVPVRWPGVAVQGMLEMWEAFTADVNTIYMTPEIKSLSVDTGTMVWKIATAAHLQRVQIKNSGRQSLIQIEYAYPNTELRGLYGGATTFGKNLCITHHVGGIYQDVLTNQGVQQQRVGDTWDGFSGMGSLVDIVGRTYIDRPVNGTGKVTAVPTFRVDSCGLTLALENEMLSNPTFDSILSKVNELRKAGE